MSTKSTALVTQLSDGKAHLVHGKVTLDAPHDNQVLVRNNSVAQNPIDVLSLDYNYFGEGAVLGCDFAGRVSRIGLDVTSVKTGDRISEVKSNGTYSEYTLAYEKIFYRIPDQISFDEAATVPLACTTAWLALFSERCLNINGESRSITVFYVGLYTIQVARAHSIPVVVVCPDTHFKLRTTMGAAHAFDYRDEKVEEKIKATVPDIAYIFDTIGLKETTVQASRAARDEGAILTTTRPGKPGAEEVHSRVHVSDILVFTAFLKDHKYGEIYYAASRADHELAAELYRKIPVRLVNGTLKPNPWELLPGGLDALPEGFQMYREGKISGFKVVYNI